MPENVPCKFPAGCAGTAILDRLERVLDPELDESILDLGFVRSLQLRSGHASVVVQLPTSWCAVNFAYMMAEDVRRALLDIEGVRQVTVSLCDHCAAEEIEAAVNGGRPFAEAFPGDGAGSLAALRIRFLHKGFLGRQERLLRELREVGCSPEVICALRLGEMSVQGDMIMLRQPGCASVEGGSAKILQRYLARRAELGLDCSPTAALIIDLEGKTLSAEQLLAHYETARTVRVAMEANGSFCRALLSLHRVDAAGSSGNTNTGGRHVPS
jgi:metal-sulfur cluster biosynthetic enzyme